MALDLSSWSPLSLPWRSGCWQGWVGGQGIAGPELLRRVGGSSSLALPQTHYQAVHHWVTNGCRRGSDKSTAVSVDVIALMKRNQPGREETFLAVAPSGWRALPTAHSPCPGKTEAWASGRGREVLAFDPFSLRLRWMKNLEDAGAFRKKEHCSAPGSERGCDKGAPSLSLGLGQRQVGPAGWTAVLLMVQPPSRGPG